jgi:hypothetical protein
MKKSLFHITIVGALLGSAFALGTFFGGGDKPPLARFGEGVCTHTTIVPLAMKPQSVLGARTFDVGFSAASRFWSDWQSWTSPKVSMAEVWDVMAPSLEELLAGEMPTAGIPWDGLARYSLEWNEARGWFVFHKVPEFTEPVFDIRDVLGSIQWISR